MSTQPPCEARKAQAAMKVKAPFHVGTTFNHGWELFSYRLMFEWFDTKWDYYFCQRLATQSQRLMLQMELGKWQRGRKFVSKRKQVTRGRQGRRKVSR